jgi:transposase
MVVSDAVRNRIVGMSMAGSKGIVIANTLQVHPSTVSRILRQHEQAGTVERKMASGRPRKLNERDERSLVFIINKNRRATLSDIANSLPTKVSRTTVRRTLRRRGIFSHIAVVKPFTPSGKHKK